MSTESLCDTASRILEDWECGRLTTDPEANDKFATAITAWITLHEIGCDVALDREIISLATYVSWIDRWNKAISRFSPEGRTKFNENKDAILQKATSMAERIGMMESLVATAERSELLS